MARKSLEDFDNDYQKYADYLESAECANDDGYTIFADEKGNEYEAIDGDWTKGHSHKKRNSDWEGREKEHPDSKGRHWYNKWLKYSDKLELTKEEVELLNTLFDCNIIQDNDKSFSKRR